VNSIAAAPRRLGLISRLLVLAAVLAAETLLGSYLIQTVPVDDLTGAPALLRHLQHWSFRFVIAYGVSLVLLASLRGPAFRAALSDVDQAPIRMGWALAHVAFMIPFLYLSPLLYTATPFWAAALALIAALAPLRVWTGIVRKTRGLPVFAILPAAGAVAAIQASQMLWAPAASVTFRLVRILLVPFLPALTSDPVSRTLMTDHFAVRIADICSGLEGIGLMIAFCAAWLWFFRREYYFPRALIVVPIGVAVVFLLNGVRIAVLVLIGDAGYERIATVGFHSQAGWIAFNLAAFGVAILAHTNPWLSRAAAERRAVQAGPRDGTVAERGPDDTATGAAGDRGADDAPAAGSDRGWNLPAAHPTAESGANPTAAYLMPFLGILAAGMIAHASSADFEWLYPVRLVAAGALIWLYRRSYAGIDFRCSWRGPLVGAAVFALWWGFAAYTTAPEGAPLPLEQAPPVLKDAWIACRVIAAVLTVPIAEELAYRGYLLRRVAAPEFESLPFARARWPALLVSAVAFGMMHGSFWPLGIIAGLAYGAVAMRTNKLGESIAAHATTNALLAACVLSFGRWQLW
jgi:CAAX prenyl protease-like protein